MKSNDTEIEKALDESKNLGRNSSKSEMSKDQTEKLDFSLNESVILDGMLNGLFAGLQQKERSTDFRDPNDSSRSTDVTNLNDSLTSNRTSEPATDRPKFAQDFVESKKEIFESRVNQHLIAAHEKIYDGSRKLGELIARVSSTDDPKFIALKDTISTIAFALKNVHTHSKKAIDPLTSLTDRAVNAITNPSAYFDKAIEHIQNNAKDLINSAFEGYKLKDDKELNLVQDTLKSIKEEFANSTSAYYRNGDPKLMQAIKHLRNVTDGIIKNDKDNIFSLGQQDFVKFAQNRDEYKAAFDKIIKSIPSERIERAEGITQEILGYVYSAERRSNKLWNDMQKDFFPQIENGTYSFSNENKHHIQMLGGLSGKLEAMQQNDDPIKKQEYINDSKRLDGIISNIKQKENVTKQDIDFLKNIYEKHSEPSFWKDLYVDFALEQAGEATKRLGYLSITVGDKVLGLYNGVEQALTNSIKGLATGVGYAAGVAKDKIFGKTQSLEDHIKQIEDPKAQKAVSREIKLLKKHILSIFLDESYDPHKNVKMYRSVSDSLETIDNAYAKSFDIKNPDHLHAREAKAISIVNNINKAINKSTPRRRLAENFFSDLFTNPFNTSSKTYEDKYNERISNKISQVLSKDLSEYIENITKPPQEIKSKPPAKKAERTPHQHKPKAQAKTDVNLTKESSWQDKVSRNTAGKKQSKSKGGPSV